MFSHVVTSLSSPLVYYGFLSILAATREASSLACSAGLVEAQAWFSQLFQCGTLAGDSNRRNDDRSGTSMFAIVHIEKEYGKWHALWWENFVSEMLFVFAMCWR